MDPAASLNDPPLPALAATAPTTQAAGHCQPPNMALLLAAIRQAGKSSAVNKLQDQLRDLGSKLDAAPQEKGDAGACIDLASIFTNHQITSSFDVARTHIW